MGKRKRPSRATRKRAAPSAPSPAPRTVADDGGMPPARERPAVEEAAEEVAQDAVKKTDAEEAMEEVQSEAEKETTGDVDSSVLKCNDQRADDAEMSTPSRDNTQTVEVPSENILTESSNSPEPVSAQSKELAGTELQSSDDVARLEITPEEDKPADEKDCSEMASENGPEQPPPQNDSDTIQENDGSKTTDSAPKSAPREAPKNAQREPPNSDPNSVIKVEAQEEKKTTKPPPEDAWTQTDDLSMDVPELRPASSTKTPIRTQDEAVTSSDQTGSKEYTASLLARIQASGRPIDGVTLANLHEDARRMLLSSQGVEIAAPLLRPKRSSDSSDDSSSSETKRRALGDTLTTSAPRWGPVDATASLLRMRQNIAHSKSPMLTQRLDEDRREFRSHSPPDVLLGHGHSHEAEKLMGDVRGIRYPNGLVVPQPPAPQRRLSPSRADRASISPPVKQNAAVVRTAEEYVTLEDDEDPMADAIRLMKAKGEFPCRLCNQIFRNLRGMKGHARDHFEKKPPYHCNVCTLFYPDKAALGRHMKIHTGERPYECGKCNFAFTTKANCERHMKNRHKLTREELPENMKVLPTDSRPNPRPRSPPPPTQVQRPTLSIVGDLTVCTVCDASFGEYTPAVQHVKKFHPTKEPALVLNARGVVRSAVPSPGEPTQRPPLPLSLPPLLPLSVGLPERPMSNHSRSSTPRSMPRPASPPASADDDSAPLDLSQKSERPEASAQLPHMPSAEEALRSAASFMQMPYCMPFPMPFFMPSMQVMNRQMEEMLAQTRNAGLSSGGGILTPAQMQAALQSAFSVGALGGQVRPPSPQTEEDRDRDTEDEQAMNLTPASASSAPSTPGALDDPRKKQKQRRYRTVRPYQCAHCDARFTLSTNMDRHVKNTHPDKWEPKSRGVRRSATVVSPMASPAEPPSASEPGSSGGAAATVVCVDSDDDGGLVIDEPSRDETDLASVDRLVVSAQAQSFQQYFRGEDGERSSEAGSERDASSSPVGDEDAERAEKRRSAYSNAPNKIPCRFCDRVFPWSSSLKRHELTHSGEKPYSCPHCPVHFTTKSNCDRHLVRKHSGGSGSDDASATQRPVERPFKCALCPSSTFSTQENLTRHHAEKHAQGAAGPATHQFWCHVCDRRFFDLERARDHLEADHEQSWAQLERSNSTWVSQIAEEDQGQDQIFCLVCLHGFCDTTELRQHMVSEHQTEDHSPEDASHAEDGPHAEEDTHAAAAGASSPPLLVRAPCSAPPRKRPTLEDISARLLAGSRLRAAGSPPAEEEGGNGEEKLEVAMDAESEGNIEGETEQGKAPASAAAQESVA